MVVVQRTVGKVVRQKRRGGTIKEKVGERDPPTLGDDKSNVWTKGNRKARSRRSPQRDQLPSRFRAEKLETRSEGDGKRRSLMIEAINAGKRRRVRRDNSLEGFRLSE